MNHPQFRTINGWNHPKGGLWHWLSHNTFRWWFFIRCLDHVQFTNLKCLANLGYREVVALYPQGIHNEDAFRPNRGLLWILVARRGDQHWEKGEDWFEDKTRGQKKLAGNSSQNPTKFVSGAWSLGVLLSGSGSQTWLQIEAFPSSKTCLRKTQGQEWSLVRSATN